jgi:16S rRNA G966 N2-methylase RsmD
MFRYKIDVNTYLLKRKDREIDVTMNEIIRCPLGGDFKFLPIKEQDENIDKICIYYQNKGIYSLLGKPYDWENHMYSVIKHNPDNLIKDGYISFSNLGNKFLMSHFPNYWKAASKGNQSPKEVFENKKYLSEIVRKIILIGKFPNSYEILKSLQRYRGNKSLSGFMPCVAKAVYKKYCNNNDKVLDFCAGYGGRLFGAMSCEKVKSYTGIEVNFETYNNLHELYRTLKLHADIQKEVNLYNQDSVLGMNQFNDKVFDFCFTSPPYFDVEEYSEEENQSFKKYEEYGEWFEEFLIKSIKEAMRVSKKVAINVGNSGGYKIADDLEKYLIDEKINYKKDFFKIPQYGGNFKLEPIFVTI